MRATIKRGGRIEPRTATVRGMYNYIVKVGTDAQETRARGSSPLFSLRDRDFEIRRGRRLTRPPLPSRARIFTLSGPKHRPILFPLFSFFFFFDSFAHADPILYYRGRALTTPRGPGC